MKPRSSLDVLLAEDAGRDFRTVAVADRFAEDFNRKGYMVCDQKLAGDGRWVRVWLWESVRVTDRACAAPRQRRSGEAQRLRVLRQTDGFRGSVRLPPPWLRQAAPAGRDMALSQVPSSRAQLKSPTVPRNDRAGPICDTSRNCSATIRPRPPAGISTWSRTTSSGSTTGGSRRFSAISRGRNSGNRETLRPSVAA